jgi:hypothetical protein
MFRVVNPHFRKASLPDGRSETQLLSRAECETTLDELDCPLDGYLLLHRDQDVKVIWHYDEVMEKIFVFVAVVIEDFDE